MKLLGTMVILIILTYGKDVKAQERCDYLTMIAKIDSLSNAKGIEKGRVNILYIHNMFDKTETCEKRLTESKKIHFEGPFLVIEDKYFNLNKLLYFYIEDGVFEFFFQGY